MGVDSAIKFVELDYFAIFIQVIRFNLQPNLTIINEDLILSEFKEIELSFKHFYSVRRFNKRRFGLPFLFDSSH